MFTLMVISAAITYSIGGYFMKLSHGLTNLGPTTMVFILFALGAGLQTLAMRGSTMVATYIIVLGLEASTAFILGALFLQEPISLLKLGGIIVVVIGIAILRFSDLRV
jgi:multidrug transporter EmrE-like cation transporter